jgi:hypothetical protein
MEGRTKKNRPTQLENIFGFRGELMESNHSLAGFLFSRFLLVGLFSFLVQKKRKRFLFFVCFSSSCVVVVCLLLLSSSSVKGEVEQKAGSETTMWIVLFSF